MKNRAPVVLALLAACSPAPCTIVDGGGGPFCLPDGGVAAAGVPIRLQVHGAACDSTCVVEVDGGVIALSTTVAVCPPSRGPEALRPCFPNALCDVPALPAGDYLVVSDGADAGMLRVADAGVNTCELPQE